MTKCICYSICALILSGGVSAHASAVAWERHCQACHDGRTILNGRVVIDREQIRTKYTSLQEFVNACGGSPSCMNIVKHDRELLREVGKELGLTDIPKQ